MKKIVIVAGDTSGDLYGALLSKKIKEKINNVEIFSFGGPELAKNSKQILNLLKTSVCGIFEIFSSLKELINNLKKTIDKIKKIKPDLIILIDFPDFNLRLAKKLNNKFKIFYFVSPQVWAWRKNRINILKKYVEKIIVIFKFEKDFYKKEGLDVLYFGHPLLEIISKKNIEQKNIISFMPGSRKNEVKLHLPIIKKIKTILEKELKDYKFRIIRPKNLEEKLYNDINIDIIEHNYEAIEESKFIIASSGTATVELAILEVPFLIIYKLNPLTFLILKNIVKTKFIGMVNILANKKIIKEYIQKMDPQIIAKDIIDILKNKEKYQEIKNQLKNIKEILQPLGATEKFSDFIKEYLS